MDRDQRLLEEAYEKVHSVKLLPEEELYIKNVCRDIYDNAERNIGKRLMPQRQHLYDILFHNPALDQLSVLNYPEDLSYRSRHFYEGVYDSLARNVYIQSYKEPNGKVIREKYYCIYALKENSATIVEPEVVDFKDREKVLAALEKSFTGLLQRELRWAIKDDDNIFIDLLKWRDKKFRDIEVNKQLSNTFNQDDLNVFNDF